MDKIPTWVFADYTTAHKLPMFDLQTSIEAFVKHANEIVQYSLVSKAWKQSFEAKEILYKAIQHFIQRYIDLFPCSFFIKIMPLHGLKISSTCFMCDEHNKLIAKTRIKSTHHTSQTGNLCRQSKYTWQESNIT